MEVLLYILIVILVLVALLLFSSRNYIFNGKTVTHVSAPLEQTFTTAMNEDHMKEWLSNKQMKFVGIERISGEENEAGSQWKLTYLERGKRKMEMIETVTDFIENERFSFDLDDKMFRFHIDMLFKRDGEGSIIEEVASGTGKKLISKAMLCLFSGQAQKMKKGMYQKLKEIIERESGS